MKYLLLSLCVFFLTCISCARVNEYFNMSDDHWGEELAEAMAEGKLGLPPGSIDFTPASPE